MDVPSDLPSDDTSIEARRYAGNAFWLLSAEAAGKIASFLFVVIVARGLGVLRYGYFNFALSFVPLFLMMAAWGLNTALVREVARDRARMPELLASAMVLRLAFGVGALTVSFSVAPLLVGGPQAFLTVVIVGSALLLDEFSGLLGAVFRAFETMRWDALVTISNRFGSTLLALLVLAFGGGLIAVSVTYLMGSFGALVVGRLLLNRRFSHVRLRDATRGQMGALFRLGLPLGIAAVLNMALLRIDAVMLQGIKGPVAVAMYGVAYRFFESFLFVGWALPSVVLPRLSRVGAGEEGARLIQLTAAANLAFYVPIAAGAPFAAEELVRAIFSGRFSPAADAVPWLTAGVLFYSLAHLARTASIALGRGREIAWIAGAALALNVGLNAWLIPRFSFEGAAIATLASEIAEALALGTLFFKTNRRLRMGGILGVPLIAAALMIVVLLVSGARGFAAVGIGGVVYLVSLVSAARLIAPREARRVASLLRRPPAA